jgi:capsular exopolysaccharide synthesis family protein
VDFNNAQNTFSLGKLAGKVLRKWYWLVLSILLCLAAAYLINRYTAPLYNVSASVYVKQAKDDPFSVQEVLLSQGGNSQGPSKSLYNEIYFLKSRSLVESTLRELDFGVSYYEETDTITVELYKKSPIQLVVDTSSQFIPYYEVIGCTVASPTKYLLHPKSDLLQPFFDGKQFEFGKAYNINGFKFTLLLKQPLKALNAEYGFMVNTLDGLVDEYTGKLTAETEAKEASIIVLSSAGRNAAKEKDFLDKHIENFIENDLYEKNLATAKTSQFIDKLLGSSTDTLGKIQNQMQNLKSTTRTGDMTARRQEIAGKISNLEAESDALEMSVRYADYLITQLQQNVDVNQLSLQADENIQSPQLDQNIKELSTLQAEISKYGDDLPAQNPLIREKQQRIEELKRFILSNVRSLRTATNLKANTLNGRIASLQGMQESVIPRGEREFEDIQRSFQASEEMVNFLMKKKADAGIARASTASDYKPVDPARVSGTVQDPMKNFITAFIIGLLFPIAFIVVKDSFNTKLVTKRDLLNNTSLPLLGIIGYDGAREKSISYSYKASLTAESFRSVRTNLGYFIDSDENAASDSAKVLLFVSSISREGKTYCSKYLSFVLSLSGKKTLLINADMRKPDRNEDLEAEGFTGLSHYLSGKATIDEIILRTKGDNLFYVKSGEVPPNPSELLITPRMQHLIDTVKASFDYIIIDTPPIGAFSDSVVLLKYADLSVCVVRQNHTTKPLLDNLNELHQNNPHIKMALLFNYVDMKKLDSGYRRSYYNAEYYQGAVKPSWWKRLTA